MTKKIALMEKGSMTKALLTLGIPTILTMMIGSVYNLVDAFYIGKLGTDATGAITVILPLIIILSAVASIFGMGASSLLSRQLGKGDGEGANSTATIALLTNAVLGLFLVFIAFLFKTEILTLVGASGNVLALAEDYTDVIFFGNFLMSVNIIMYNILRAEGDTLKPLLAAGGSAVLNAILNPILMFSLGMGIRGAAAATVMAQGTACLILIIGFGRQKGVIKISLQAFRFSKAIYSGIIKVGLAAFIFQLLSGVGLAILNVIAESYGAAVIAGMGIVGRIVSLGFHVIYGFTKGFQPVAGYNYGAGNYQRVKESVKTAMGISTLFSTLFGLAIGLFAPVIGRWFSTDPQVIAIVKQALIPQAIMSSLAGIQLVIITGFLALGMAKEGGILSLAKQGLFFIPLILLLPRITGLSGIIYAQPIADLLTFILVMIFGKSLLNRLKSPEHSEQMMAESL